MSADADGVVGKIKGKAKEVLGDNESRGDADPDIDYEPTPDQHILHDGMVVLSESQAEGSDEGDGEGDSDGARAGDGGSGSDET